MPTSVVRQGWNFLSWDMVVVPLWVTSVPSVFLHGLGQDVSSLVATFSWALCSFSPVYPSHVCYFTKYFNASVVETALLKTWESKWRQCILNFYVIHVQLHILERVWRRVFIFNRLNETVLIKIWRGHQVSISSLDYHVRSLIHRHIWSMFLYILFPFWFHNSSLSFKDSEISVLSVSERWHVSAYMISNMFVINCF